MTGPRNVLFLWTDEQRPDTIAAYGNPAIRTPHLDRLAAESVLFEQAYCAQPVCTPSRGTVLTGVYPHTHGAVFNNVPLPEGVPTIAELLRPRGYRCAYAGKWHLGREVHAQRGFDWWSSIEDGYTKDHRADGFSSYHHWLLAKGYRPPDTAPDGARVFGRATAARLPEAHGKPAFLAQEACRFLDEHRARGAGQPFALYVNFLEPHMPYFGPRDGMYPAAEMALPETWYAPPAEGVPLRYRVRREAFASGGGEHLERSDEPEWKALKARYWGLASLVDTYCGVILDHLRALGLAGETVVVFSSDHGDMMGEHRLLAKTVPYEGSSRVPLLMRVPGVGAKRIATPVSQVDLVPTLLEALDVPPPAHLQGASLLPLLRGGDGAPEEAEVVMEWSGQWRGRSPEEAPAAGGGSERSGGGAGAGAGDDPVQRAVSARQRTIRLGAKWKLTVDEAGQHELYDLVADPHETLNLLWGDRLAGRPAAAAATDDLWRRLRAWQERTADSLALPRPRPWLD